MSVLVVVTSVAVPIPEGVWAQEAAGSGALPKALLYLLTHPRP